MTKIFSIAPFVIVFHTNAFTFLVRYFKTFPILFKTNFNVIYKDWSSFASGRLCSLYRLSYSKANSEQYIHGGLEKVFEPSWAKTDDIFTKVMELSIKSSRETRKSRSVMYIAFIIHWSRETSRTLMSPYMELAKHWSHEKWYTCNTGV